MATSKKDKKIEKASTPTKEVVAKKQETVVKEAPKKEAPKKPRATKKTPKFVLKEVLILDGKECIFVEKLKGKVVVRFEDGTFTSAKEEDFTAKQ